ncbi:hypothetical protein JNUCC23_20890 [Peribacillus sp. JNUCC 23]
MDKRRLERMEEMLANLITITGNMDKKIQDSMDATKKELRNGNEKHHNEILDLLKTMQKAQDYVWGKTVCNERELARIESQLQLSIHVFLS